MVETSLLISQLTDPTLHQQQGGGQSLPAPEGKDADRFQDLMLGEKNATISIEPQTLDNTQALNNDGSSVLQLVGPGQGNNETGLVDKMIDQATKIDSGYHSLLEKMGDRPGFDSYLNNQKDAVDDKMMTYPHVNNDVEAKDTYAAALDRIEEVNNATLQYQSDMNQWAMGFRMWSAGVEVIASAAKKVSQGFQTLFRASG